MEFALEFSVDLIYVWCFIEVGQLFFNFKRRSYKYEKWIFIGFITLTAFVISYTDVFWQGLCHLLCVISILYICFEQSKKQLFGLYVGVSAIMIMLPLMFEMMMLVAFEFIDIEIHSKVIDVLSCIITWIVIVSTGRYFKRRYPNGLKGIGSRYLFFFAMILLLDAIVVGILGDFITNNIQAARKWILIIIYIGVVVGILIQIVLLINALITRNVYRDNEILAKQYLDSQQDHYSYLEKREYETKRFRHDIKNHLLVLEHCIEQQEYEDALRYIEALNDKVNAFSNHISVNNNFADAILNKFYFEAKEQEIELEVKGHFPLECSIAAFDICTILSNLLSNAILAEKQCGGKVIQVEIRYTTEDVIMLVENDYGHDLQEENGEFRSTKLDSANHGFGLKNVKLCVEKAGGYISITTKDHRFKVMLSLKNKCEEKV